MQITETGGGLSVLIITEMGEKPNWQTFCCWYSFWKNLPDAQMAITCQRFGSPPFALYQWARRLKLNLFFHNRFTENDQVANWLDSLIKAQTRKLVGDNVLIVSPLVIMVDTLGQKIIDTLMTKQMWINEKAWFLKNSNASEMLNKHFLTSDALVLDLEPLYVEAKEAEKVHWLVNYQKGCGKWIHTSRGCPFSSAAGLATGIMTVNENRVIELWKRMCSLYSTLQ